MSIRTGKLTVFFEEPFWVGIFERVENGKLSVSKVTFGTEPKDYEIWEFVLKEYDRLQFSPSVEVTEKELTKNPKKLQREIHKQSYKMNIDEAELLDEYKEKLLAMRIEIIKLKAENQKLESELDTLRRQQKGVSDVK